MGHILNFVPVEWEKSHTLPLLDFSPKIAPMEEVNQRKDPFSILSLPDCWQDAKTPVEDWVIMLAELLERGYQGSEWLWAQSPFPSHLPPVFSGLWCMWKINCKVICGFTLCVSTISLLRLICLLASLAVNIPHVFVGIWFSVYTCQEGSKLRFVFILWRFLLMHLSLVVEEKGKIYTGNMYQKNMPSEFCVA